MNAVIRSTMRHKLYFCQLFIVFMALEINLKIPILQDFALFFSNIFLDPVACFQACFSPNLMISCLLMALSKNTDIEVKGLSHKRSVWHKCFVHVHCTFRLVFLPPLHVLVWCYGWPPHVTPRRTSTSVWRSSLDSHSAQVRQTGVLAGCVDTVEIFLYL